MIIRSAASRTAALALTAGLALAALTGCGDDAETNDSTGGSSTATTTSATPTPEPTAPADTAAAEAEIGQNWTAFFENGDPALLEDGEELTEAIAGLSALAPPPRTKSATVTAVEFNGPDDASITYDLIVDGAPALPGATGEAVLIDGVWKVSKNSFCTLTTLASGVAAPGCS